MQGKEKQWYALKDKKLRCRAKGILPQVALKNLFFKSCTKIGKWTVAKTLFLDPARFSNGVEPSETNNRHPQSKVKMEKITNAKKDQCVYISGRNLSYLELASSTGKRNIF